MELWTTLRRRPHRPLKGYFGRGQVKWSTSTLAEPSFKYALAAAHGTKSQMVLWGFVQKYGPGVIVQAYLSISKSALDATSSRARWVISDKQGRVELGLPSYAYEFSPLILPDDVVKKYSRPDQIRVCKQKEMECDGPTLSKESFRGVRQEGEFALVKQNGMQGWVYLPNLSSARGEVVDFTAAMISYCRGDFEQAERRFARVSASEASGPVQFDALVLSGLSMLRGGKFDISVLEKALKRNPYSQYTAQALAMSQIQLAFESHTNAARRDHINSAAKLVKSYRHLFSTRDRWLQTMDALLNRLRVR